MNILFELFTAFFRVGLFTFGGGYAAYPLILESVVDKGWLTEAQFADIWGVSNMIPGAVAVNTASFVGYTQYGVPGALVAAVGAILPSFSLVIIAMFFIAKVNKSRILKGAFGGLRPAATGLIGVAAFRMAWATFFPGIALLARVEAVSIIAIILFAAAFAAIMKLKIKGKPVNPIYIIVAGAFTGVAVGYMGLL